MLRALNRELLRFLETGFKASGKAAMKRLKERSPEKFARLGIVLSDSDEEKNDEEEHDDH